MMSHATISYVWWYVYALSQMLFHVRDLKPRPSSPLFEQHTPHLGAKAFQVLVTHTKMAMMFNFTGEKRQALLIWQVHRPHRDFVLLDVSVLHRESFCLRDASGGCSGRCYSATGHECTLPNRVF